MQAKPDFLFVGDMGKVDGEGAAVGAGVGTTTAIVLRKAAARDPVPTVAAAERARV